MGRNDPVSAAARACAAVGLPAEALPAGTVDVEVTYTHVPGVRLDELVSVQRPLHVGRLWLAGE